MTGVQTCALPICFPVTIISFIAVAIVGGEKFPSGDGKSKREAEQAAAKLAYEVLSNRSKNK